MFLDDPLITVLQSEVGSVSSVSPKLVLDQESFVAESALDMCDWDPRRAFVFARNLASAVKTTRRLASQAVPR